MTKLTAKDLMVGDYVQCPETNHIFKVQTISGGEQDTLHYVTAKNGNGDFLSRSEWYGVPLTAEIIEKNGFLLHKSASYFKQYMWTTGGIDDYVDVYIEVGQDQQDNWRWDCLYFKLNFCGGDAFFRKKHYVHELQHALKLCKIDKTIEL